MKALEQGRDAVAAHPQLPFTPLERQALLDLGADIKRAWHSPGATPQTRKRILRTVIDEIVVSVEGDALNMTIHWQGGDHTPLRVRKNPVGQHRWSTVEDMVERRISHGQFTAFLYQRPLAMAHRSAAVSPAFSFARTAETAALRGVNIRAGWC